MPYLAPKVRDDLEYFDQVIDGEDMVLVRDPIRGTYIKWNVLQVAMLRALDGQRRPADIAAVLSEQFEVEIPPQACERFIARARELMLLDITSYSVTPDAARKQVQKMLRKAGFRERSPSPREAPRTLSAESALFAEAFRQLELGHPRAAASYLAEILQNNPNNARAKQLYDLIQTAFIKAAGGLLENPQFVLFNPSRLLTWLSRTIGGFLFSWKGVVALLTLFMLGAYSATNISIGEGVGPLEIAIVIVVYIGGMMFHEMGHGLACQYYGGNVTEIGFLFFYNVVPAAYCDTSSSYTITNRRHKVMVQLAGSVASLTYISTTAIILGLLNPDLPIYRGLVLELILESTFAFVTLIPFMKFDGYYAICDHYNFPNLRDRAFTLTRKWLGHRFLGIESPVEDLPQRTRRLMIVFALISFGFTIFFLYVGYLRLLAPIVEHLRSVGLVLAIVLSAYMLRNLTIKPLWGLARLVVRERRRIFTRRRTIMWLVVMLAMSAPWFWQRPITVDDRFVIVPHQRSDIRAQTAGRVDRLLVNEGARVRRGEPLATLRNPALQARIATLEAELEASSHQLDLVRHGASPEALALARSRLDRTQSEVRRSRGDAAVASALAAESLGTQATADRARGQMAGHVGAAGAAKAELSLLEAGARREEVAVAEADHARIASQLAHLRAEAELLTLRSPIDGIVVTPHLEDKLQAMLAPGDLFAQVHDLTAVVAEIALPLSDPLAELAVGDVVILRPYGDPHAEVSTRVARFHEAAVGTDGERQITVVTTKFVLARPVSGLTGHARIYGAERSLAYSYLYLPFRRLISVRLWSI